MRNHQSPAHASQGMEEQKNLLDYAGCDLRQFGLHHCCRWRMPFTLACLIHTRYCCLLMTLPNLCMDGEATNPTEPRHLFCQWVHSYQFLRVAVKHLILLAPTTILAQVWTKIILKQTTCIYHICVPWMRYRQGHRAPKWTCMDSWVCYALVDNIWTVMPAGSLNAAELAAKHGASALEDARTSDVNAPWTCAEFKLQTIGTNLNK